MEKPNKEFCTWILENDVDTYGDMVYRLALARSKNVEIAKDITQSVFLKLVHHVRKFYEHENPECQICQSDFMYSRCFASDEHKKAWLLRVTINLTNDYFKCAEYQKTQKLDLIELQSRDCLNDVYHAVLSLDEPYKTAIHLFYTLNFSIKDIGELMNAKENTIKSWLHRGRSQLRNLLLE